MVIKETTNSQSIGADVNEIFFGYYLTNNWDDFKDSKNIKAELTKRAEKLDADEVDDQKERAKVMANITVRWMKKNGYDGTNIQAGAMKGALTNIHKQFEERLNRAVSSKNKQEETRVENAMRQHYIKIMGESAKSLTQAQLVAMQHRIK